MQASLKSDSIKNAATFENAVILPSKSVDRDDLDYYRVMLPVCREQTSSRDGADNGYGSSSELPEQKA